MRIEYEPPRKKQPVYACFKALLRIFVRKVRTVTLGGELSEPCLYLANHANKMGPMIYSMFFPVYHVNWGASQMLGNYRERYRYLRDILYIKKNGTGRAMASFRAFFEAFFSQFVYRRQAGADGEKERGTPRNGHLAHDFSRKFRRRV